MSGNPVTVRVEIADTPSERQLGLMYRTDLEADEGMLFLFEDDAVRSFWMKNTPSSLDILFLDRTGRIVGIRERTEPFSLAPISVGLPSRMVLEVLAGFSEKHGIEAGDRIRLENVASALHP